MKINHTTVWGFRAAIRGMRHPYKSTEKSDSGWASLENAVVPRSQVEVMPGNFPEWGAYFKIGEKDMELAKKLVLAGPDHGKFLRMVHVQCDITAPLYWWKQLDTYKVGTTANSESTMHTIMRKPFTTEDFSFPPDDAYRWILDEHIERLNTLRDTWMESEDVKEQKEVWETIICLLPESYLQTRTWDANYAVLRSIYHARKNHKLKEWHEFCEWVEELPYSELIAYV